MLKVLIADDEKKIGLLIKKLILWDELSMECMDIVQDGEAALRTILKDHPDIVITDIRMPGLSGLELIERVTDELKEDAPHFIVISGYRYFEYARKAIKYGVEDYLLKPIEEDELNNVLRKIRDSIETDEAREEKLDKMTEVIEGSRGKGKHYDYDVEKDIVEWEKTPEKLPMEDGQVFDLGDRKVTAYHCPGHTAGEMVFIDDKSRILFLADACNCNLLLAHGFGKDARDEAETAKAGLKRLLSMKEKWDCFYNAHHDFRGLGQTLYPSAIQDAINCYESLLSGTAEFHKEADPLFLDNPPKVFAQSGVVKISYMDGDISKAFPNK